MKRRFTGFWQPRRPTFNCGYVAGEHARKVVRAEARARQGLIELAKALGAEPPSPSTLAWDARQGVRWQRTGSRAYLSFRRLAARRFGLKISVDLGNRLIRSLSASRQALDAAPWRDRTDYPYWRLRPRVSGLYKLIWPATRPPWPKA